MDSNNKRDERKYKRKNSYDIAFILSVLSICLSFASLILIIERILTR